MLRYWQFQNIPQPKDISSGLTARYRLKFQAACKAIRYMIQLTKLKPRGDYAYEEGIQMVQTAWTRPRCCFNSDFCRTKGSGIHFVVLVVGIKSNLAYILIFRRYFFRYLGRRADC